MDDVWGALKKTPSLRVQRAPELEDAGTLIHFLEGHMAHETFVLQAEAQQNLNDSKMWTQKQARVDRIWPKKKCLSPGIPTTIKTMGVNITTIVYLRVLIIQIGSTIILMVVEA